MAEKLSQLQAFILTGICALGLVRMIDTQDDVEDASVYNSSPRTAETTASITPELTTETESTMTVDRLMEGLKHEGWEIEIIESGGRFVLYHTEEEDYAGVLRSWFYLVRLGWRDPSDPVLRIPAEVQTAWETNQPLAFIFRVYDPSGEPGQSSDATRPEAEVVFLGVGHGQPSVNMQPSPIPDFGILEENVEEALEVYLEYMTDVFVDAPSLEDSDELPKSPIKQFEFNSRLKKD